MNENYDDYDRWLKNRKTLTEERNHPNHWFNRASDLRASAGALWVAMEGNNDLFVEKLGLHNSFSMGVACWPVYHMLCGLSLELIFKAVIVQLGGDVPKTHDLNQLAGKASFQCSVAEKQLLKFYKASVEWSGRYPIPNRCNDDGLLDHWRLASDVLTKPDKRFKDIEMRTGSGATDWENYHALWSRIAEQFRFD
ncbi:hypothetical protein SOASR015_14640 [Pectobacterium carotovorum subsp. carotovorum]|nr:hypothetical protein SOASR015_14640 [Pectobacterium carotovorum subsp. carotovorum]GLX55391.1 hypothetical protein Pcaca02_07000 [Pectobacterium carotovorum subsp. carotovorum]